MNDLDYIMSGFNAEMTKKAFLGRAVNIGRRVIGSSALHRGLGGIGAGAGAGGALGAAGGAAYGGIRGLQEARERGELGLGGALVGAGTGAVKGGLWGAGLGAAGLGGAAALSRRVGEKFVPALAARSGAARFGQRQVHGMTGWLPTRGDPTSLRAIKGGAYSGAHRLEEAEKALEAARAAEPSAGIMGRVMGRTPEAVKARRIAAAEKEFVGAQKGMRYAEEAERMGLTSLPGYAKSLATPGQAGKTITTGLKEQWHGSGPMGRALIFGFPAATIGHGALATPEPGGPSRSEATMGALGDIAYAMGPMPIGPQLALASALSMSGARLGRLLSGRKKPQPQQAPPQVEPADGASPDVERYYSERALGHPGGIA